MMQDGSFEIIGFAREVPEMKPDGSTVTFRPPAQLIVIQAFREAKHNFMDIFETVKNVVEGMCGHRNP